MNNTSKKNRDIFLYGEVNDETIETVSKQILEIIREDDLNATLYKDYEADPINLYINSNGGYVSPAFALINLIRSSSTEIHTICLGAAYSSGFLIFLAGDYRTLHRRAELMYHELSTGVYGQAKCISELSDYVQKASEMITSYILERTLIPRDVIEEINSKKQDKYFSIEEVQKYVLADEII